MLYDLGMEEVEKLSLAEDNIKTIKELLDK